ncbi:MAG: hypothetical protein FJW40_20600 [Acidobacteria bacterium]|nr:hypothetical protein [Acidobacteriota bacterium]
MKIVCVLGLAAVAASMEGAVGIRILMGVGDRAAGAWDGSVEARGARVERVEPWRFDGQDEMLPGNRWRLSTHTIRLSVRPISRRRLMSPMASSCS